MLIVPAESLKPERRESSARYAGGRRHVKLLAVVGGSVQQWPFRSLPREVDKLPRRE